MIRLILLTPLLCACDLNVLEGKPSEFQKHHKRLEIAKADAEPEVAIEAEPEAQECIYDSFRVYRCIDGKIQDWWVQ